MDVCSTCSVHSTADPKWCDHWRPPPLPTETNSNFQTLYRISSALRAFLNNNTNIKDSLQRYASICPGHAQDITTGETQEPTANTPFQPAPVKEVSTAGISSWLIVVLVLVIGIGVVVAAFIWYKKKHGRYILTGPCCRCFNTSGVSWAKLSGKYFKRYNSKRPESIDNGKDKLDMKMSVEGEVHVNYISNENQEFLLRNQNYNGTFHISSENINNVSPVKQALQNDYVDYSNVVSSETKDSEMTEKLSTEQTDRITDPEVTVHEEDNSMKRVGVQNNKENKSNDPQTDITVQSVKKRKKRSKFRQTNKVHSSPSKNSEQEIKTCEEDEDKRKTF